MADFSLSSPPSSSSLSFSQNNIIKLPPHIPLISPSSLPPSPLSFSLSKNRINPPEPPVFPMEWKKKKKKKNSCLALSMRFLRQA